MLRRGQDMQWDLLNYHFYNGFSFLEHLGSSSLNPVPVYASNLNPIPDVLTYVSDRIAFPIGALFAYAMQIATVPLIYLLLLNLKKTNYKYKNYDFIRVGSTLIAVISPIWLSELGTSFPEGWLTSLVILALWLNLKNLSEFSYSRGLGVGFSLGLASGLKLTFLIYLAAWAMAILVVTVFSRIEIKHKLKQLSIQYSGALLGIGTMSFWYFQVWRRLGNPFFPFYNTLFRSKYFSDTNWKDPRWGFHSLVGYLKYLRDLWKSTIPETYTSELSFRDRRIDLFLVLLMFFLIWSLLSKKIVNFNNKEKFLLIFFSISYALWAIFFGLERYGLPNELLWGVLIAIILQNIDLKYITKCVIISAIFIISICSIVIPDWGHRPDSFGNSNPFHISVPKIFTDQPAVYISNTNAVSYIFPYFSKMSVLETIGDSVGMNIKSILTNAYNISQVKKLPVRYIIDAGGKSQLATILKNSDLPLSLQNYTCKSYIFDQIAPHIFCLEN